MRRAMTTWVGSRALFVVGVLGLATYLRVGGERHPLATGTWWLDRLAPWDSYHFVRIARDGYFAAGQTCCDQSYFPGYPLAMRALAPFTGGGVTVAGLVVTLLAGLVAAAALYRLAAPHAPGVAVTALAVAPATVFLVTVYSEALWLAAGLLAWLAARDDRWWLAGLAAAVASGTRVTGLFLWAGLVVAYAVRRRLRVDAVALVLPLVPPVVYAVWLHERTGTWDAWRAAQATGWDRVTVSPWEGLTHQWDQVTHAGVSWLGLTRALDLVAVLVGLLVLLGVARQRRWAEATYLALSVGSVMASTVWDSAARYALTWFPVYLLLGRGYGRRPRLVVTLLSVSTLVALVVAWLWTTRRWAG